MTMPTWINEVQALGSLLGGLGAVGIAAAGLWIADRQSRTAAQKLRLDLFPLRYAVYDAMLMALADALNGNTSKNAEDRLWLARKKVREARFLFCEETFNYLDGLETKTFEQGYLNGNISETLDAATRAALLEEKHRNAQWLLPQMQILAQKLQRELKVDAASTFSLRFLTKRQG